jgi:hypothetical protein
MKKAWVLRVLAGGIIAACGFGYLDSPGTESLQRILGLVRQQDEDSDAGKAVSDNPYQVWLYEYDLLKSPYTGRIPPDARVREWNTALSFMNRQRLYRLAANSYNLAGPDNISGRTRAIAYDLRYNGSSNQTILTGGVSGGVFRSTNGGQSWQWVSTPQLNSVTSIVQDPRTGTNPITNRPYYDTWYCGTGEFLPTSFITGPAASDLSFIVGWGMFQSDDDGQSWYSMAFSRGTAAQGNNSEEAFDNAYDIINRLVVNPVNGNLYVSRFGSIVQVVEASAGNYTRTLTLYNNSDKGQLSTSNQISDIVCSADGTTLFAAFHGAYTDPSNVDTSIDMEGIWQGKVNLAGGGAITWKKISGQGSASPAGWPAPGQYGRIVLALVPADQHLLFALVANGRNGALSAPGGPQPEADLFRYNDLTGQWTNLSANVPRTDSSNRGAFQVQNGYDMAIAVSPSDTMTVYIGGTNAYRSTDGFTSLLHTTLINGYGRSNMNEFGYDFNIGHPDIHYFSFRPGTDSEMICSNDGGIQKCTDILTPDSVSWINLDNSYQTLQYYYVTIDPENAEMTFAGGAQDNQCTIRNSFETDPNSHDIYIVGDGCSVGLSSPINNNKYFYLSSQNGGMYRASLDVSDNQYAGSFGSIKPSGAQGDFITLFYLDPDNTENLYFASTDTLFRTTAASTVSSGTWTRMTGVNASITSSIRSMATTRGSYSAAHNLFFGTDGGKVYRMRDPANALPSETPADISDPGMQGVVIGLSVNPRNDDTLLAVISNYDTQSIWWTGDANDSIPVWQAIEGSGAGNLQAPSIRSCAIISTQTAVEYFVGTQIGLYSTTLINGANTSWTPESASGPLQYAIVSSLALRWSDNTLVVGTHGNGMFYTSIGSATGVTPPPDTGSIFIRTVYPTLLTGTMDIQTGTLTGVTGMHIFIFNILGQLSYESQAGYQNQSLNLGFLPGGMYLITIVSNDGTHRYTRKFIRQ